jgi:hypothetical protein
VVTIAATHTIRGAAASAAATAVTDWLATVLG